MCALLALVAGALLPMKPADTWANVARDSEVSGAPQVGPDNLGDARRAAGEAGQQAKVLEEGAGQLAAVVGELPDRQLVEVGVVAAPGQLGELVVGRTAEHHGVAVLEVLAKTRELGDLGLAEGGAQFGPASAALRAPGHRDPAGGDHRAAELGVAGLRQEGDSADGDLGLELECR